MAGLGKTLWRVVVRLLISAVALVLAIVIGFLSIIGPPDMRWLAIFAFYFLTAWTFMPVIFLNTASKTIASVVWIGVGIHAYMHVSPVTYTPQLFPNWCAATVALGLLLVMRFSFRALATENSNLESTNPNNGDS